MTDVRPPRELATSQDGVVARWQLIRTGMSERSADCWVRGMRALGDGVFLAGLAPPSQRQLWWAAVLTSPGTVLSHASAAACFGLRPVVGGAVTVTRVGSRGREHSRGLHVSYSLTLRRQITEHDGIPITTVERTIIDLWPHLSPRARSRMLREGLRQRSTTAPRMYAAIRAHRGRRGVASLRLEVEALGDLRLERCRSDAEAWAVALIADAGLAPPEVNEDVAGEEADLCWPDARRIIELDGPSYHVLRDADVRKTKVWRAAGFDVLRLPTDALYADPECLLDLVPGRRTSVIPPAEVGRPTFDAPGRGYGRGGTSAWAASRTRSRPS
jgi:very-short-patch-repair endonuclease